MTTFFGAVADDFTGATDLAALLARSGVSVSLRIGIPDGPPQNTAALEIIALKCRTAPVAAAVAEARAALDWLKRAGAQRFFWKYCSTFDSTSDGNIGPVAEALMADLGVGQTIYCPAFPENGRSIYMGNLFVGEQPLAESPMKDHPLTPMRDSNLLRLLEPQVTKPVGLVNRLLVAAGPQAVRDQLAALDAEGTAHVVIDAVANDDLYVIAEACRDTVLMTGGSAVAMRLPAQWREAGWVKEAADGTVLRADEGSALVLSGSCSAMTNKQVAAYLATGAPGFRLDPLELAANGPRAAVQWLQAQEADVCPIIYATADSQSVRNIQNQLGADKAGALVEDALAACAVAALGAGTRRIVVAGGETSGAVIKALGVTQLSVGKEIAPGVPWCFTQARGSAIAVTLKSGNFGGESFFRDALDGLKAYE